MYQADILDPADFSAFLPIVHRLDDTDARTNVWDIPHTIGQLSYLTHSHYRYYGKFPSAVAAQILESHFRKTPSNCVVDHFCGSGTTLVEAKLRGIPSYGIDISWIATLVSNVKTRHVDLAQASKLIEKFKLDAANDTPQLRVADSFADKWFSPVASESLERVRNWILQLAPSAERDFLVVAFLAIIRRVSKAHDGEVRPHINKGKRERDVFEAFIKKVRDMIADHGEFQAITSAKTVAECYQGDNSESMAGMFKKKQVDLVVSHPPYLNSFNYRPVFSLEFYWAQPFEKEYSNGNALHEVRNELLAHPASDDITDRYFEHLRKCYQSSFDLLSHTGKLAVVIGDCTRNGKLIPVIENTVDICKKIGFKLIERNYRTTHYGLGKYAYKHRADYHGDEEEKKDAIVVFSKN